MTGCPFRYLRSQRSQETTEENVDTEVLDEYTRSSAAGRETNMTGSKCKPEADDEAQRTLARARRFLADNGIDCAAIIHREDAACFMVEFAKLEKEFSGQMKSARAVMQENQDALQKLGI